VFVPAVARERRCALCDTGRTAGSRHLKGAPPAVGSFRQPGGAGGRSAPGSPAGHFHVFAALWDTDDTVTVYVDGQAIYKAAYKWVYDDRTPAGYAHVLLDLAIGGKKWAGRHGIDRAAFPQGLEIEYVRVYQKADRQLIDKDTIGQELCPIHGAC
jgi:hypothetical protein